MEKWDPFHLHNYLETIFIHSIFACAVCDYYLIQIFYAIFCFVLSSVSCHTFFSLFIVNSISTHLYTVVVNTYSSDQLRRTHFVLALSQFHKHQIKWQFKMAKIHNYQGGGFNRKEAQKTLTKSHIDKLILTQYSAIYYSTPQTAITN